MTDAKRRFKQYRRIQRVLRPEAQSFTEPEMLQLLRTKPKYFGDPTQWWNRLSYHDQVWAALEANWRWEIDLAEVLRNNYYNPPVEDFIEQFGTQRIRGIVDQPDLIWLSLTPEEQHRLYAITEASREGEDLFIAWYPLMENYNVGLDLFEEHATSDEWESLIASLVRKWARTLDEKGISSPIQVRFSEFPFTVPDPRVGEILPPMLQAHVRLLHAPRYLFNLREKPGSEQVVEFLHLPAQAALAELEIEQPILAPGSPPDIYDWFYPEIKEQWANWWAERASFAIQAAHRFVGRVFHVPGIPGNEKVNAMTQAGNITQNALAWADAKEEELRQLKPSEMQYLHDDWEEWEAQFYEDREDS